MATLLLDEGMPLEQVQRFLRHNGSRRPDAKHIATTQIYAETSLQGMAEHYVKFLEKKG